MCLFLARCSLGLLFTEATRKYSAAWHMLECTLWVRCSGLRLLQQKAASLSALCSPLQPALKWSQGGFFSGSFADGPSQEAGGSNRAVTWFCAKSAALCLLGGGKRWLQTGLLSLRSHSLWAGGQRPLVNYRLRRPPSSPPRGNSSATPHSASAFLRCLCNPRDTMCPGFG